MVYVGINGLGRIGKCIFLQAMCGDNKENKIKVRAINVPGFDIKNIETYLKHDSTHSYSKNFTVEILNDTDFLINGDLVTILNNRDASKLGWRAFDINYVIDTTGVYLDTDKCLQHMVDYVIMGAPAKDNTDQFVYNVNHETYAGQKILSNASCTTNALAPVLSQLENIYGVNRASFTTVHAATASQNTIDTNNFKNRTSRSILNNIIPHSTGANKSITKLIPSLANKVVGTSLRVPVMNVSIIDLTVVLDCDAEVSLSDVLTTFSKTGFITVSQGTYSVSSDFNTTTCPSIVDGQASMKLTGKNEFKLLIWYDNEWSYSHQLLRMVSYTIDYHYKNAMLGRSKYFIEKLNDMTFSNKNVVVRVDWNVPIDYTTNIITNDYRIVSSLHTLRYILSKNPNKVVIVSHLGRPDPKKDGNRMTYSWSHFIPQLATYFPGEEFHFLSKGLTQGTLEELRTSSAKIHLLENIRFHQEETEFLSLNKADNEAYQAFSKLGDAYVNDAFGCCHRPHMSIVGLPQQVPKAYGYLVEKELNFLDVIERNINHDRILAIIGGAKMKDKLTLCKSLAHKVDGIYIAGGNINSLFYDENYKDYIQELRQCGKAKVFLMKDGLSAIDLTSPAVYQRIDFDDKTSVTGSPRASPKTLLNNGINTISKLDAQRVRTMSAGSSSDMCAEQMNFYDIGMESIIELNDLIQSYDTIFWNGTLGVVEHNLYSYGSTTLVNLLMKSGKKVIVGGGDTAGFVQKFDHEFQFVSTGGGATIDFLSKGSLVGTDIFEDEETPEKK
jgi:glyceraldehyde 3-phosphate dehydrogenase